MSKRSGIIRRVRDWRIEVGGGRQKAESRRQKAVSSKQ
jgi:hypothetical protein